MLYLAIEIVIKLSTDVCIICVKYNYEQWYLSDYEHLLGNTITWNMHLKSELWLRRKIQQPLHLHAL